MNVKSGKVVLRLLGALSVYLNGASVTPSATKQRQIIALLALNAGHVVTVPTLIHELWKDSPPRSSAATLQTYVLQVRNRLAGAAARDSDVRTMISTRYGGYMLEAQACQCDVSEFRSLAQAGRTAAEAGDDLTATDMLGRALALWRGSALADMGLGPVLELEAASLETARLGVLERRITVDLRLGRHTDLLGELTLLAAKNPMNENFCALLMTALYRSGHVGHALEAFRHARTVLRDELGVEPCPRLQRLQQRILSGDPALDTREPVPGRRGPDLNGQRNLMTDASKDGAGRLVILAPARENRLRASAANGQAGIAQDWRWIPSGRAPNLGSMHILCVNFSYIRSWTGLVGIQMEGAW
ncbi:MAG TPA: AfsR/SARP family transcriptional regulator [Trebonia sp.]|jgi:DNA-binding SARP family transcriptional activator|nr:AfsR/SARP family transcriptional regulator [Trebonia sp.]